MKKSMIICKDSHTHGILDFYLSKGNDMIYLFSQKFRHSIYNHYHRGLLLDEALSYKKAHKDKAIMNVIKRLHSNIGYIEKTYGIIVMNKTFSAQAA
ncbi:MAG: hypothetical protein IKH75_10615 [Ruminococcus sp.]|nr:hypothetical protein [Ruminococcus sp.]